MFDDVSDAMTLLESSSSFVRGSSLEDRSVATFVDNVETLLVSQLDFFSMEKETHPNCAFICRSGHVKSKFKP